MPSTVNGIGTWYYGKDNLVTRNDRCEFCGNHGELKSYDTTLYFVVFFIPLIPMGRKRILDECPVCRRHRAVKLSEWERRKEEVILSKTEAWQQDRGNKDKAFEAIGSTIAFHDAESFNHLAGAVGDAFKRDADVQIFLGNAYDHFGDKTSADTAFRAAVVIRPDEASKEALARFLLRQIRPTEAEPLLAHVLPAKQRPKAGLLLALAETYQANGDHESAYRIVDDVGTAFPDMLSEPGYERVRRSVSKYRGTNKVVKSAGMERSRREGARQVSWFARHSGAAILGGLLLVAAIWYLSIAFSRGTHTVSVVNGTPTAYTADINGQRVSIPALGRVPIELPEGPLRISVPDKAGAIEPATVHLRTNFWKRPFDRRNFVINPDRAAVVMWEQAEYSHSPGKGSGDPHRLRVGDVLYDFDKVDYVFEDFPRSLKVPDESKPVKKTRLTMYHGEVAPTMAALIVKADVGSAAAADWARHWAAMSNDDLESVQIMTLALTPAEQIEFFRPRLAQRPLRIEWHRRYQNLVQVEQPKYDLVGEYRALAAKNPDDAVMTYLLARIVEDRDEAIALFRKAAEAPTPCAYASYALSYDAMNAGDFPRALERARAARKIDPEHLAFRHAEAEALEALGQPGEAQPIVAAMQKHQGMDAQFVGWEVRLLAAKKDIPAVRTRIDAACQEHAAKLGADEEAVANLRNDLESVLYYATGDLAAYRKALAADTKSADARFHVALSDGKLEEAQKALAESKPPSWAEHLILYIAAKSKGNTAIADAAWTKGIDLLKSKGEHDDRLFAAELTSSSNAPPSDRPLRNWTTSPAERCIMLTALGLRYPQKQADYFAAARKLNYTVGFPSRLIAQVTK